MSGICSRHKHHKKGCNLCEALGRPEEKTMDIRDGIEEHKKDARKTAPRSHGETAGYAPESCSFCGKLTKCSFVMIAGPNVAICNECIGLCNEIIYEKINKLRT